MIIQRRIAADVKMRIEDLSDEIESFGYKFIELRKNSRSRTGSSIMGPEQAKIVYGRAYGESMASASNVQIIKDGVLDFHPDAKGICWGYLLDTAKNRNWLASQLKDAVVTIADATILEEIKAIAKENDWPTEKTARDITIDAGLVVSKTEVDERDAEIEALKAQLAAMEEAKKEVKKPLAGKKTTKK